MQGDKKDRVIFAYGSHGFIDSFGVFTVRLSENRCV